MVSVAFELDDLSSHGSLVKFLSSLLVGTIWMMSGISSSIAIAGEKSAPVESTEDGDAEDIVTPDDDMNSEFDGEFVFGSYGRTQFELDPGGNRSSAPRIVHPGPRLLQQDYVELDFLYHMEREGGLESSVVFTLALFGPFAHYDGDFADQSLAVRNLYAEFGGISETLDGLDLWVGSRMYRGDDVYLLDTWPLDELNTVGGGASYRVGGLEARVHAGVNRLDHPFQWQAVDRPAQPIGATSQVVLDRQRFLSSGRLEYVMDDLVGDLGAKAVAYGEFHRLPDGQRVPAQFLDNQTPTEPFADVLETLPADRGWVLGTQLGLFESGTANHLNLFFRLARGLAAYGELGIPHVTAQDGTATGAQRLSTALSGNWESHRVGVMAGTHLSRFTNPHPEVDGLDEGLEATAVVRPVLFVTDHFHQGLEISYQHRYPFAVNPETGAHHEPAVWQLSVLEILSLGRGNYERPQIRLGYTVAFSNEDAQRTFPVGDERRPGSVEHVISLGAEWWFNSSTY